MHNKNIQKTCVCFVLAVAVTFTLGGCTVGKNGVDGNNASTPATVAVNASNITNDNKQPSRLEGIQDRVSIQHR